MAKRLVSNDPNPKDVRFSHFGVLDDGKRSKGAAITSIVINGTIILLMVIVGMIVKTNPEMAKKMEALYMPPKPIPKPVPKPPPPPPPKPVPELPKPPKIEPPKIKPPVLEKLPDIKPMVVPVPKPVVLNTPAPMKINPPPAPRVVNLATPKAASIANNDAHPSAVRLGNPEIKSLSGPPVASPVNLAGGMHNMSASNTGNGPRATSVNLGSGSPAGTDIHGKSAAAVPVKGFANGVPGGTGKGLNGPQQVQLQAAAKPPPAMVQPVAPTATLAKPPHVTSQPKAQYTAEATALHLQGEITVSVVFRANDTIQVLGIVGAGLGHGLNESALAVARGIVFTPALDSNGHPIDFPTKIIVRFVSNS